MQGRRHELLPLAAPDLLLRRGAVYRLWRHQPRRHTHLLAADRRAGGSARSQRHRYRRVLPGFHGPWSRQWIWRRAIIQCLCTVALVHRSRPSLRRQQYFDDNRPAAALVDFPQPLWHLVRRTGPRAGHVLRTDHERDALRSRVGHLSCRDSRGAAPKAAAIPHLRGDRHLRALLVRAPVSAFHCNDAARTRSCSSASRWRSSVSRS